MDEHRVVILARDGELSSPGPHIPGQSVVYVCVDGCYEAAAEILTQPAAALLVELSCLTPPHRKLLHVARQLGVEVLGVGTFPAGFSAGDLSGMRLISLEDLPTELCSILERIQPPAQSAPPVSQAQSTEAKPKKGAHLAPARKAEYRPSPHDPPRQSRIISPANTRDSNPSPGRGSE
jgi:hypothetical protein